ETALAAERFKFHAISEVRTAKKVLVAVRDGPKILVQPEKLDVGFNQRRVLPEGLHLNLLLRHNFVHHFAHRCWLLATCSQRDSTEQQSHRQDLEAAHKRSPPLTLWT